MVDQRLTENWPELPLDAWQDTYDTLQLWTQIVGKIRLAQAPMMNHWWHVPLYVTCRGLTTSPMPHESGRSFQIDFDFIDHRLLIEASDGTTESLPLAPCSVADFYREVMDRLESARAGGADLAGAGRDPGPHPVRTRPRARRL